MGVLLGATICATAQTYDADTLAATDFYSEEDGLFWEVSADSAYTANDSSFLDQHPAAELYRFSWTSERINPYGVKIDSIPDSTFIDVSDFVYPVQSNRITSPFGMRRYRWHYGTDSDYERNGYGHYVVIRHDNGLETVYAHLSRVLCTINQDVAAGDVIGLGGNSGHSTGPHLHYEARFLGNAFNTAKLIDYQTKTLRTNPFVITLADTYSHNAALKELAKARYHTVRKGDTLSGIARRYGTTVSKLCQLNRISSKKILRIGQKIRYR